MLLNSNFCGSTSSFLVSENQVGITPTHIQGFSLIFYSSIHSMEITFHLQQFSMYEQIIGLVLKVIAWIWRDLLSTKTPYHRTFNYCIHNRPRVFHWFGAGEGYKPFFLGYHDHFFFSFWSRYAILIAVFSPITWMHVLYQVNWNGWCTFCTVENTIWVKATGFQTALKLRLSGDWESLNWMQPPSHFLI